MESLPSCSHESRVLFISNVVRRARAPLPSNDQLIPLCFCLWATRQSLDLSLVNVQLYIYEFMRKYRRCAGITEKASYPSWLKTFCLKPAHFHCSPHSQLPCKLFLSVFPERCFKQVFRRYDPLYCLPELFHRRFRINSCYLNLGMTQQR